MTTLDMLWLPIILSSVVVFIVSSVIHMLSLWHKNDFPKLKNQTDIMDALRPFNLPPGEYMVPRADGTKEMASPEFAEIMKKGPVAIINTWKYDASEMPKIFIQWFLYLIVVGIFAGYVAGRALPVGAPYLHVFRFVGVSAFLSYSLALWQLSIWYHRPWSTTIKMTIDGLVYALFTAGVFGWLWPK